MHLRQRSTQLILWIACLALAVGALLPSVTHSVRQAAPNGWFEVCTSFGAKWVRASEARTDSEGPEAPPRGIHEHCAYCVMHAGDLAVPPARGTGLAPSPLQFALPARFLAAPRTLFAWRSAQARGPPRVA